VSGFLGRIQLDFIELFALQRDPLKKWRRGSEINPTQRCSTDPRKI
jgi:hypothetical protein